MANRSTFAYKGGRSSRPRENLQAAQGTGLGGTALDSGVPHTCAQKCSMLRQKSAVKESVTAADKIGTWVCARQTRD